MAEDYGNGVTRTLSALARQFTSVVWQAGKPPLDSELNLMGQLDFESLRTATHSQVHSGFFLDPCRSHDFNFAGHWSNHFFMGHEAPAGQVSEEFPVIYAAVNGMILPICGTFNDGIANRIRLNPPPQTDARIDLVFLEVWRTLIAPNPSDENKPSAELVHKYGNTEYGGTNINDDLEDPAIGFETTERVQVQYRIRVFGSGGAAGDSAALDLYPDGLEDPGITGQGAADDPQLGSSFFFSNMGEELGDPGLWRAGEGDENSATALKTVDGYTYAIPICAVFRRNSNPYKAVMPPGGSPNHNGAAERNPGAINLADPRDGAVALTAVTLDGELAPETYGDVAVDGLIGSGFDASGFIPLGGSRWMVLGEGGSTEIIEVTGLDITGGTGTVTIPAEGRGRGGTPAQRHLAGTSVQLYNTRPDHLYADEVADRDLLDLRRSVSFGDWDFHRLLLHNIAALAKGEMHTTWKQNGALGGTQGPVIHAVDYLWADGSGTSDDIPDGVDVLDGPDGVRTTWSDAATFETAVVLLDDEDQQLQSNNEINSTNPWDDLTSWNVGAPFVPTGFLNSPNADGWENGSVIKLHIGGVDGTGGARATFRNDERAVRFVSPKEMWRTGYPVVDPANGQQHPVRIRFLSEKSHEPAPGGTLAVDHPGPYHPWRDDDFETPFLVLGGLAWPTAYVTGLVPDSVLDDTAGVRQVDLGIDFDAAGVFRPDPALLENPGTPTLDELLDTELVTTTLVRGERTLFDLLTAGGQDFSGESSELYLVLYGDETNRSNNGAFKVLGAGTLPSTAWGTKWSASSSTQVVVKPLSKDFASFVPDLNTQLKGEFRTQWTNSEDGGGAISNDSALCIVLTDLEGLSGLDNPWGQVNTNPITTPVKSKMVITTSLLYHPGRSGTSRGADTVHRLAVVNGGTSYLRNNISDIDTSFPEGTSFPEAERHWGSTHVQLWNRLGSLGWDAPKAPHLGGGTVLDSESERETELFVDTGSKTVVFRPFQKRNMTLQAHKYAGENFLGGSTYTNGDPRDGAAIWVSNLDTAFALPPEWMPRLGRQDIPHHTMTSLSDPHLPGFHHLFSDSSDETDETFCIIGGEDNQGNPGNNQVTPMLFQTGSTTNLGYCEHGTIGGFVGHPAYQARLADYEDVISSDLGHGMEGIELPPNIGIARLYGVYELQEYLSKMDQNVPGMHEAADRVTPLQDGATNLLRTNGDKQTLFIRGDGGKDVTGVAGDHTYIVPSEAINHTLAANFDTASPDFDEYDYVVETVVFGFANGFITKNNYVLARKTAGTGHDVPSLDPDGNGEPELEDVGMVLACAANINDEAYAAYSRTPYQGDPFMTRAGEDRDTLDYQHRYGQIALDDSLEAGVARAQFDSAGNVLPKLPNPRAFEVLASMDFYTTMGTGKIGGSLTSGNLLDVGFVEPGPRSVTRVHSQDDVDLLRKWRVVPRAFTEGQKANSNRASAEIVFNWRGFQAAAPLDELTFPNAVLYIDIAGIDGVQTTLYGAFFAADPAADFAIVPGQVGGPVPNGAQDGALGTAGNLVAAINASPRLTRVCKAYWEGSNVRLESVQTGAVGNQIRVGIRWNMVPIWDLDMAMQLVTDHSNLRRVKNVESAHFTGGADLAVNAGAGASQLNLTGMTERLPLGILLQDSDFLCENPLGLNASAFKTSPAGIRPIQSVLPMTERGTEYERFFGAPGEIVSMCDGAIKWYAAHDGTPASTGTDKFRLYRGGGSAFVISGREPGGPLDWVSEALTAPLHPVLKGGALACKALLVRNFPEKAWSTDSKRSDGDEIQMLVVTHGILRADRARSGVEFGGIISPTGFGEGMAAADRYLIAGRPLVKGRRRDAPDPGTAPAPFPGEDS